jgi:hypothetical protein
MNLPMKPICRIWLIGFSMVTLNLSLFAQNIGIGTNVPLTPLHVFTDADIWHTYIGGHSGQLQIGGQTNNGAVIQSWNPSTRTVRDLYLQRDGGKVGVGTNATAAGLHIVSVSNLSTPNLLIEQSNTGNASIFFKTSNGNAFAITSTTDGSGGDSLTIYSNTPGANLMAVSANPQHNISLTGSLVLKTGGVLSSFTDGGLNNDVGLTSAIFFPVTPINPSIITGISGGVDGRVIIIYNFGPGFLSLKNFTSGVVTGDRLLLGGSDIVLTPLTGVMLLYVGNIFPGSPGWWINIGKWQN